MKTSLFSFLFFLAVLFANVSFAQTVEVIDFHNTNRCKTCLMIEKSAKSVLEKEFANELKSGKIVFKTVNVDKTENAQISEQFEASGSALWIYRADKKIKVDLTDFAFMNVGNAEKFSEKVKAEIQKALK